MRKPEDITQTLALRVPRGSKRRHAQAIDLAGRLGWIIHGNHGVVITAV